MRRFTLLLLVLALLFALPGCSARERSIYEQDYDYLWDILDNEYPHYHVAERLLGRELDEIKEQYAELLPEVESAEEFYELVVKPCLDEFKVNGLSIGHLDALDAAFYNSCVQSLDEYPDDPRIQFRRDELLNPKALQFYRSPIFREGAGAAPLSVYVEANQVIRYFPEQNAAYVRIKNMTNDPDDGKELLSFFATLEERGYEHCIIDIRGNTGGDTMHWMAYIVGPNFAEMPRCDFYQLLKGDYAREYAECYGISARPISELPLEELPELCPEDLEGVDSFFVMEYGTMKITYGAFEPPLYTGRFWLLTDGLVYSASDSLAADAKASGFATLVGERTGGNGIGYTPVIRCLPNTGICFRYDSGLGLNPDGSANSEVGTAPDYECESGRALDYCLELIEAGK